MDHSLRVTLLANAGLLLQYHDVSMLLDGIYGSEEHAFSDLKPDVWEKLLLGQPPFEQIDFLLFTHVHPDHFSPEKTMQFLEKRSVKGVFLPDAPEIEESGLAEFLRSRNIPYGIMSHKTNHASFGVAPEISVRGISTLHLSKKYHDVHHVCYLITFGEKRVLFTADVDYMFESLDVLNGIPLRAVFLNPLFFSGLRRGRFFKGSLATTTYCLYHIPFSEDDSLRMRKNLANDLLAWPPERGETLVLCDSLQHIDL